MSTLQQFRVVPFSTHETTRISLTDAFHRINSLLPERQILVTVPPNTTVAEALDLMQERRFSQLPVVAGNEVIGVFSFRSFATKAVELGNEKVDLGTLAVDEFMEQLEYVHIHGDLDSTFSALDHDDAVLVGQPNRLQGIVTPMDVLRYLYGVASPFVMLAEIELALRGLIDAGVNDEEFRICVENSLTHHYADDEQPTRLKDMNFNDYAQIIGDGRNWPKFEAIFGGGGDWQRKRTRAKLEEIRDLRNDIFHFKRELTRRDHETLLSHRNWLLTRARIVDAEEKSDHE